MKTQQQQQLRSMRALLLASRLLSFLLLVLLLAVTCMDIPTVTAAASFVAQRVKGQRKSAPILPLQTQLQAVAKTPAAGGGAKKKTKKATATVAPAASNEATPVGSVADLTVRKGEFIDRLAAVLQRNDENKSWTKKQAEMVLNAVVQVIQEEVASGKKVMLPSFGSFVAKDRAARKGRNPQTGNEIDIAASKSPTFAASKSWKDALNGK
jgi:DNA-binding protein HU-beta